MSVATAVSPSTQTVIDQAKQSTERAKQRLANTLNFVPDDKLGYKPCETAKSPLRIAAHAALTNHMFASIIRQQPPPVANMEEVQAMMKEKEEALATREQVIEALNASVADVNAALDAIDDEALCKDVPTPVFTAPMIFWMNLPTVHMANHAGQIDYIQTLWGDMEWHM